MKFNYLSAFLFTAVAFLPWQSQAAPIEVDLELVLAVDVSGSIDGTEYAGQKNGYMAAFNNPTIQNAISSTNDGRHGKIAVTYVEWSAETDQMQLVPWTVVSDAESSSAFSTAIDNTNRAFFGGTSPGPAIDYSTNLFSFNQADPEFIGDRQVIDISGDGTGLTYATSAARDNALSAGVDTINAIAIQNLSVQTFFENYAIGGNDAFAVFAQDFEDDFTSAVGDKIFREVVGENPVPVPEPASLLLFGLGLAGLAGSRRRKMKGPL